MKKSYRCAQAAVLGLAVAGASACYRKTGAPVVAQPAPQGAKEIDAALKKLCEPYATPVVEQVTKNVFVARGFDLANVGAVQTSEGLVIIDAAMSPARAHLAREALEKKTNGPVKALIFTHSHLDHTGGASVFQDAKTEIWALNAFEAQFLKQYGLFQPLEALRAQRQYGRHVDPALLPCTSIGPRLDFESEPGSGMRLPTRTFSGQTKFKIGDTVFELYEALGETNDTIFVYLPGEKVIFSGDNIYRAFPNLYTIRGTTPRPIDEWIGSLDHMRALAPEALVPGHTETIFGKGKVRETLTAYRDAIQYLRDTTVRGANAGLSMDTLAATVKLPPQLASDPYLQEVYGRVDWSVRAIYTNHLGWFDGRAAILAEPTGAEVSRREVALMGGAEKILSLAGEAYQANDPAWALHLLSRLEPIELAPDAAKRRNVLAAKALTQTAYATLNTNARAYLAEASVEQERGPQAIVQAHPDEALVKALPLAIFFQRMATMIDPVKARDLYESVEWNFPDVHQTWWVTIRNSVAEVRAGEALPGTPPPLAKVTVDSITWKKLGLKQESVAAAVATGALSIEGSLVGFGTFMARFH